MVQTEALLRYRQIVDIPYLGGERPDEARMDAWYPQEQSRALPACILIHGGGWTTGDKADEREQSMAADLCNSGYAVFSINYHMAEYENGYYNGKRKICAWPGCIADCMDAVSYVRTNARKLYVIPHQIGLIGSSAGGHLALLVATASENDKLQHYRSYTSVSCRVSFAVSCYGVPDIISWGGELLMPDIFDNMKEEWYLASPTEHLDKVPPPILLIHGDEDETVEIGQSARFYNLLRGRGYPSQFMIVRGGRHSFDFSALSKSQYEELISFLETSYGKGNPI